jgi:EAL domain-containing protein (putative c-di-GMP-specific phosphodiesterase class I)
MGRALIAMAHSMGIETTVFNVDTEGQAQWFREIGCDALQGPYVGGLEQIPRTNTVRAITSQDTGVPLGELS